MYFVVYLDCKKKILVPITWCLYDTNRMNYGFIKSRPDKIFYSKELRHPNFDLDISENFNGKSDGCYSGTVVDYIGKF